MASNKVRSNLPNHTTGTAVLIKGHLERRVMDVWDAWECAVTDVCSTGISRHSTLGGLRGFLLLTQIPLAGCTLQYLLPCIMLFLLLLSTLWVQCQLREGERTRSWKYPFTTSALIGTDIFSKPLSVKSESRGTLFNDLRVCKSLKSDSRNENLGGSTRQAEHWSTLLAEALIKAECQWRCQA